MTLTLEQVFAAKQPASHPDGWSVCVYQDGRYVRAIWYEGRIGSQDVPQDGWKHVDGCDCEFCKEAT